MKNAIIVKIKKNQFIDWWLEDNDEAFEISTKALKKGHKPLEQIVKTKNQFFAMCGYLPFRFIANLTDLKKLDLLSEEELSDKELEIDGKDFIIKWI